MIADTRKAYSPVSIAIHWLGATAIISMWLIGQLMEDNRSLRATHIALGGGLALFLLARVAWRAFSVNPEPINSSRALNAIAALVKILLLTDIVLVVVTGVLSVWLRGRPISPFWLGDIASPFGNLPAYGRPINQIHKLAANAFVLLVGLHVLGALKHAIWDRDGTLVRMIWPRRTETV